MSDREALAAAVDQVMSWIGGDERRPTPNQILAVGTLLNTARERLAQLPEDCGTCDGEGHYVVASTRGQWATDDLACPTCHGSGKVYPAELVKRIANCIDSRIDRRYVVAILEALNKETE